MMRTRPTLANRHPQAFARACKQWPLHERALVEGDSWFRYDSLFPLSLVSRTSNLFKSVQQAYPMVSLNLSGNGDLLHNMLSDDGLARIGSKLKLCKFQYLFLSGGGNDIVNALQGLVWRLVDEECSDSIHSPQDAVKPYSAESLLYSMRDRIDGLCSLRDSVSPGTRIVMHNYGNPNLWKGGFRRFGMTLVGPWIMPKLERMGYDQTGGTLIIRDLMTRYDRMLKSLWPAIEIADTATALQPFHWRDEMHLTPEGYDHAAQAFLPILHRQDKSRSEGYP